MFIKWQHKHLSSVCQDSGISVYLSVCLSVYVCLSDCVCSCVQTSVSVSACLTCVVNVVSVLKCPDHSDVTALKVYGSVPTRNSALVSGMSPAWWVTYLWTQMHWWVTHMWTHLTNESLTCEHTRIMSHLHVNTLALMSHSPVNTPA